ncbi:MAG: ATP-binding protein [Bacteroidales bacterium]|nr:ATP-binding protein [Bacteroidales bacterium]
MKPGGSALFRQTLLVLTGALVLSHLAGFFALVLVAPSGSNATTLSGIARQLAAPGCDALVPALQNTRNLELSRGENPPAIPEEQSPDSLFIRQLAGVLGVSESMLRLDSSAGGQIRTGRPVEITLGDRAGQLEETIFLGELRFARQWQGYWCIGEVPPLRWYNHWQASIALTLLLSLAGLLPLAWLFARRLSRPIHDFASAADTIGRDEQAPLLEEKGPTELRVAARALNAMQTRIHEQMREREAMIAAIAHDLRTPLSRIAFRVEAAPEVSESVQRDVEQMNAMISATLEFAREGTYAQMRGDGVVDLCHLLEHMVEDERAVGHPARFVADGAPALVRGNDVELSRLFQNLIDNARNFGEAAEVSLSRREGSVFVVIADRGPGIEPDQVEEVFRPFTRGEPSRNRRTGGIGLGLSITRAIARRHGGEVRIANRDGGGLRVTVTLPMV